jgi:hypothetical protein
LGQVGVGAADGRVVEVPNHCQLRVALEQREHGGKRVAKLVFEFLLEALEVFDKLPKFKCRPLVLPKKHIQKRTAALVTAL